jgi:hypothetical protein
MNFLRCKNTNLIFLFRILSNAITVYYVLPYFMSNNTYFNAIVDVKFNSFENQL